LKQGPDSVISSFHQAENPVKLFENEEDLLKLQQCLRLFVLKLTITSCLALVVSCMVGAQTVLVPPPTTPPPPEQGWSTENTSTNEIENAPEAQASSTGPSVPQANLPLQWGPIAMHPHVSYQVTYGNGIQSQPGQEQKTIVQTVSPGVGFDLGRVWRLDYSPSFTIYSDKAFKDTVDHSLHLSGATRYGDWGLSIGQSVSLTSDPQVETARQTDQQNFSTTFNAGYQINGALSLDLSFVQDLNFAGGFTNSAGDSRAWSTMDWLNYHWGPFSVGAGLGFGYNEIQFGANDNTFELYKGNIAWHVFRKVSLAINGGAQVMQFLDSSEPDTVSPIYGVSLNWQPLSTTSFTLSANRNTSASTYFVNQVTESTGVNAGVSQRLLERLNLNLAGGYTETDYRLSFPVSGAPASSIARRDTYTFFSVGLSTAFLKHGSGSISYSRSQNSSSDGGFAFSSDQIALQVSYGF